MPFHQSGAGCFYFENRSGPARDPPTEGESISSFFPELLHKPFAIGRYIWYTLSITLNEKREKHYAKIFKRKR